TLGNTRPGPWLTQWLTDDTVCLWDELGGVRARLTVPQGYHWCEPQLSPDGSRLAAGVFHEGWHGFALYDWAKGWRTANCLGHRADGPRERPGGRGRLGWLWDRPHGGEARGGSGPPRQISNRGVPRERAPPGDELSRRHGTPVGWGDGPAGGGSLRPPQRRG